MFRSSLFLVAGLAWLCTMPLAAQDAVLGQIYGNGVHAYFSEDYLRAHQLLTAAIDGHTQDPRAYYFRGLVLLKLGRPHEAENDFQQGAKLESAIDPTRAYDVARALERIQGSDRAKLEQFRLEARMTVLKRAEEDHMHRYQATLNEQREFLQRQSAAGVVKPNEPEGGKSPEVGDSRTPPPAAVPADPFSMGDGAKTPEPKKEATVEPTTEPATPAPGIETPAEKPAAKPAAAKPSAGGDDPFAEPKPATPTDSGKKSDPSAEPKPATPVDSGKKSGPAKAEADDDPFGAGSADSKPAAAAPPKASKTPETVKPAPASDDPFTAEPPTAKPSTSAGNAKKPHTAKPAADDDPFAPSPDAAKPDAGAPAKPDDKKPAADDPFGG